MFDELADLIEKNKDWLSQQTTDYALHDPKLPQFSRQRWPEQIASQTRLFAQTFQQMANYIRTGDPTEWRNNAVQIGESSFGNGYDAKELITVGLYMIDLMKKLVDRTYPGEQHAKTRRLYYGQLDNLNIVARTTLVSTQVKKR